MKTKIYLPAIALAALPTLAWAQTGPSLQNAFAGILSFTEDTLIPFLFGIAFLMFVINVVRYFIFGADNKDSKEKAKGLAIYSVAAFVFLIAFWGLINLLVDSIGLGPDHCTQSYNDYYIQKGGTAPPDCF